MGVEVQRVDSSRLLDGASGLVSGLSGVPQSQGAVVRGGPDQKVHLVAELDVVDGRVMVVDGMRCYVLAGTVRGSLGDFPEGHGRVDGATDQLVGMIDVPVETPALLGVMLEVVDGLSLFLGVHDVVAVEDVNVASDMGGGNLFRCQRVVSGHIDLAVLVDALHNGDSLVSAVSIMMLLHVSTPLLLGQ